ncbi:MAG: hypothetical protein WDO73_02705 [Ignavibacteriota bacterium]
MTLISAVANSWPFACFLRVVFIYGFWDQGLVLRLFIRTKVAVGVTISALLTDAETSQ